MTATFLETVTLLETPHTQSPFYVVEGANGKRYVSSMGGRAAKGLPIGVTLSLYRTENATMYAYILERV